MKNSNLKGSCLARPQETDAFRMLGFRNSVINFVAEKGGCAWCL